MPLRRYNRTLRIKGGTQLATSRETNLLYRAVRSGAIPASEHVVRESERLDILAGKLYNNAGLWWVIAAASGIGWGLQVPPGTILRIPDNLADVSEIIG